MQFKSLLVASLATGILAAPTATPQGLNLGGASLGSSLESTLDNLLGSLGLGGVAATIDQLLDALGLTGNDSVQSLLGGLGNVGVGLKKAKRDAAPAPAPAGGLLQDLDPDVQSLLIALGLKSLAPGVGGALTSVGDALK